MQAAGPELPHKGRGPAPPARPPAPRGPVPQPSGAPLWGRPRPRARPGSGDAALRYSRSRAEARARSLPEAGGRAGRAGAAPKARSPSPPPPLRAPARPGSRAPSRGRGAAPKGGQARAAETRAAAGSTNRAPSSSNGALPAAARGRQGGGTRQERPPLTGPRGRGRASLLGRDAGAAAARLRPHPALSNAPRASPFAQLSHSQPALSASSSLSGRKKGPSLPAPPGMYQDHCQRPEEPLGPEVGTAAGWRLVGIYTCEPKRNLRAPLPL